MEKDERVWGVIRPNPCYHTSTACPHIRDEFRDQADPTEYADKDAAFKAGHLRPCPTCADDNVATKESGEHVRLTAEQLDTLRVISKIYEDTGESMTLAQIATRRGRKVSTCFAIVNDLIKKGLVENEYDEVRGQAKKKSIKPTPDSDKVLKQLAGR